MTRRTTFLTVLLMTAFAGVANACPMCKDTIANTSGPGGPSPGLSAGFNLSIYTMFFGFFSMLALIIGVVCKGVRDSDGYNAAAVKKAQAASTPPSANSLDLSAPQS